MKNIGWALLLAMLMGLARGGEPVEAVDPMIGADGHGSCMPGPCLPHSSIYPSPDTLSATPCGYKDNEEIIGFAQLHTQGTGGVPSFGNLLVSPQIGPVETDEKKRGSPKADEVARAWAYAVTLQRFGIRCEVVPSSHSALYKLTFPAATDAHVLIDVARKIGDPRALRDGSVKVAADGTITGGGIYDKNWAHGPYKLFFTAKLSRAPDSIGTWQGSTIQPGVGEAQLHQTPGGAFAGFKTTAREVIYLKLAVSFKSQEQSATWLQQEIPGWDFDGLQAQAKAVWNKALGALTIEGADAAETARFETALFHSLVQPRDRTGDNWDTDEPFWDDHYTLWDSWRTVYPLLGLIDRDAFSGIVHSFIARHKKNGYVPEAMVGGVDLCAGQGGNEVDNVIAEAWLNHLPGVSWEEAYAVQQFDADQMRTADYRAKGYVSIEENKQPYAYRMHSASGTIEFAFNDYCVGEMAGWLGKTADAAKYTARALNWRNVWDDSAKEGPYAGFPRSRHQDGSFDPIAPRAGWDTDFYEGTCWVYSYRPDHAMPELIAKMGGPEVFVPRLLFALHQNLIDFTNEPSFQTIWLFDAVHRPYLASRWAENLREKYKGNAMPGDEDNGAMSSLYVFLDLGLFPFAGQDIYYLHGTHLPKAVFHLGGGKTFVITGQNVSPENIYVQSATLNGKALNEPMLRHDDILNGGTLDFVMGPQPSAWGCGGTFDAGRAEEEVK